MEARFIRQTLRRVRTQLARMTLLYDLWLAGLMFVTLGTTAVWYEKTLYLPAKIRTLVMLGLMYLTLVLSLVMILRWLGLWRGWWPWVSIRALAARVGRRLGEETDRLLNALQLEDGLVLKPDAPNADLVSRSVGLVADQLRRLDLGSLTPRRYRPPVWLVRVLLLAVVLAWVSAPRGMYQATKRLRHPGKESPTPTPFILLSVSGDREVLGGDTVEVVFTAFEASPPEIEVVWFNQQGRGRTVLVGLHQGRFVHRFMEIRDDVTYYARFRNPNWFSHWEEVRSEAHHISLTDRPVIQSLSFLITPPAHTGEATYKLGGNVADISALGGSRVAFTAATNLPLTEALLHLGEEELPLEIDETRVQGEFVLEESTTMFITVRDRRDVTNADPIQYRFTSLVDYPPTLTVIMPLVDVELDEAMLLPIQFDVSDDYGFSQAQITYEIRKPQYLSQDYQIYTRDIPELAADRRSQRITHLWDLGPVGLMPGDEVHFHLEVYDNNVVSGPGKAVSATLVARVPTLTDLFAQVADRSAQSVTATEGMLEELEKVRSLLEEMEQNLMEENQVSWEQQQKGKEVFQTLQEVLDQLERVQREIREMGVKSEDNQLFSPDLLRKYDELQNLLEQIMSADLEEAMNRLREALENMDPEQLRQALQNLQFQADEFEAQLDRFLDIFQRALAELKMDEVVRRLEELVAVEEELLRDLDSAPLLESTADDQAGADEESDQENRRRLQDLAARHAEQERSLQALRSTMRETAQLMKPYSSAAADRLGELPDNQLARDTQDGLARGTRSMQAGDWESSNAELDRGTEQLSLMHQEATDIQDQFQDATVSEMMARFQRVLSGVLTTSMLQEDLHAQTARMPRSSPRVREAAEEQHNLVKALSQVIQQLMALSRQSFNITPEMGRAVGQANAAMHNSVEQLESGNMREATDSQLSAMTALNETAVALNNAMQVMMQSGSASGYEQYLQRMQNLSQGQQGLNQQTLSMQLGQMAAMSQAELMRRLQARQRQLAQALEEILNDYPSQSGGKQGGLGQALQDMEEIIKDFQRRRVTRRTLDRQQRILSRMLDHQKSLAVDDFKQERQGRAPTERFTYAGPLSLQSDQGQREDAIMQAMDKALREGYSQEYQRIIQHYFRRLAGQADARK